jgi:RNA-directed DNA polymerase
MQKLYSFEVKEKAARFLKCKNLKDLRKIGFDTNDIQLKSLHPKYYTFEIPKKSGGVRKIEAPEDDLKLLQKQFNNYLQCVYYSIQSQAAYGYIIRIRDSKTYKNILENARQHMGCSYMINADFEDFFHQVTAQRVSNLLQKKPF